MDPLIHSEPFISILNAHEILLNVRVLFSNTFSKSSRSSSLNASFPRSSSRVVLTWSIGFFISCVVLFIPMESRSSVSWMRLIFFWNDVMVLATVVKLHWFSEIVFHFPTRWICLSDGAVCIVTGFEVQIVFSGSTSSHSEFLRFQFYLFPQLFLFFL